MSDAGRCLQYGAYLSAAGAPVLATPLRPTPVVSLPQLQLWSSLANILQGWDTGTIQACDGQAATRRLRAFTTHKMLATAKKVLGMKQPCKGTHDADQAQRNNL